jgi:two-component system, chemotaxis family, sensor kinase CheA
MDKDALIRRLMKTFLIELDEHVQALERDLLVLERNATAEVRAEVFRNLFRTGHSLKGAARSVNVDVLESVGHLLESIFAAAQGGVVSLDASLFDVLFTTADAIRDTGRRLEAGEDVSGGPLAMLLPRLKDACVGTAPVEPSSEASFKLPIEEGVFPRTSTEVSVARESSSSQRDAFVRVSAARLDRLIAYSGELRVARGRAAFRDADLDRLLNLSKQWQADWSAAEHSLHRLYRSRHEVLSAKGGQDSNPAKRIFELGQENLRRLTQQLGQLAGGLIADRKVLNQVATALEDEVIKARMVPFSDACEGLDRTARDLARESGKEVSLTIEGGDIEIDRSVVAGIKDALLHLVRNAVDHGIELPAGRLAVGKATCGRIALTAALRQGRVEIVIADDGRGFDVDAIRAQVRKRGMEIPEDERALVRMAFAPALSTSANLTEVSGRGIGLDVVKTAVEAQRGSYDVTFEAGRGSRIVLSVPLTLTKLPVLLAQVGGQTYAFDSAAVYALRRMGADDLRGVEGRDVLMVDGSPVPVFRLLDVLGQERDTRGVSGKTPVVVVQEGAARVAFAVDELLAEQEVVVKDIGPRSQRIKNVSGATILPTGRVALILNVADLVQGTVGYAGSRALSEALAESPSEAKTRILVVDDSVTTRTLVKSILESSGYEVFDAADGMEAWQFLQDKSVDVVVSDVEMPRMDGFALTEAIRNSKRLQKIPVILVTALETEPDRMRGLDAGANAYLPKSGFDQTSLIQAIEQLV